MRYFRSLLHLLVLMCFSQAHAGSYEDFFVAVVNDDARTVKALLARGFDPNALNERGLTGLYLALREDSPKVAEALLVAPRIQIDLAGRSDETPVMMAALHGNMEWVRRLIDRGAQINRPGWTPLHYAAAGPEPRLVAWLLDRGAIVDAPAPNRTTPMMMAAKYGAQDGATLLLLRGADPRLRNDQGLTAADFARDAGRDKLAARLEPPAR